MPFCAVNKIKLQYLKIYFVVKDKITYALQNYEKGLENMVLNVTHLKYN